MSSEAHLTTLETRNTAVSYCLRAVVLLVTDLDKFPAHLDRTAAINSSRSITDARQQPGFCMAIVNKDGKSSKE